MPRFKSAEPDFCKSGAKVCFCCDENKVLERENADLRAYPGLRVFALEC